MLERSYLARVLLTALLPGGLLPSRALAGEGADPASALVSAIAAAESSLREGEEETAESRYRSALLEGWLLMGALETAEGRLPEARDAFLSASVSAVETHRALWSLALAHLQMGETAPAVEILTRLARRNPGDGEIRRRLEQALAARGQPVATSITGTSPLAALTPSQRLELKGRVTAELVRAYLNLGVMQTQGKRFSRAAELFEKAAALDPDFPQVQYSLGVAHFNARAFDKAAGPLARALAAKAEDVGLRRMLAMAWLNTEAYDKAAELLRNDPDRDLDPSLQFAYGLALARTDHTTEAHAVFAKLLARHGDSAEVRVVLGQASAQQGDFDAAIQDLTQALHLKADVAEANATLGIIYLKQGRLAEAETALRAELSVRPGDAKSQNALATVLELLGRPGEALPLLRRVLESKPDFADARYLLGKILLAEGDAAEAAEHLEAAARVAPEDANIHYQLGRAYQTLGRTELAQQQFEVFRQLKDKQRRSAP